MTTKAELEAQVALMKSQLQALEADISRMKANDSIPMSSRSPGAVHVIEGTEYERGWGQRPDGYVAFTTEKAAHKYIKDYDKRFNSLRSVPDEYTKYNYIGMKECSSSFYAALINTGVKHFNHQAELKT